MIDYGQWKFKVLLSSSTYYVLLQDVYRFGFTKNNNKGQVNQNYFINKILPTLLHYGEFQNRNFQNYITKNMILDIFKTFNQFHLVWKNLKI